MIFFSAFYQLTYENENNINQILNIECKEINENVATFKRKPNFECIFNITKANTPEKDFKQLFHFQNLLLNQKAIKF